MRKTTMYLPPDLDRALQDRARRERRPAAEVVRDAIRRYLESNAAPPPGIIGVARAKKGFRAAKDESLLEREWAGK